MKPINVAKEEEEPKPFKELFKMVESHEREIWPSHEESELVNLRVDDELKGVKISAKLIKEERERLLALLKVFVDVFVWSYQDKFGLDTNIVTHKLPQWKGYIPIK